MKKIPAASPRSETAPAHDLHLMPEMRKMFPVDSCACWDQGRHGQIYDVTVLAHVEKRSLLIRIDKVIWALSSDSDVHLFKPGDTKYVLARNLSKL